MSNKFTRVSLLVVVFFWSLVSMQPQDPKIKVILVNKFGGDVNIAVARKDFPINGSLKNDQSKDLGYLEDINQIKVTNPNATLAAKGFGWNITTIDLEGKKGLRECWYDRILSNQVQPGGDAMQVILSPVWGVTAQGVTWTCDFERPAEIRSSFLLSANPWDFLGVQKDAPFSLVKNAVQNLFQLFDPKTYGLHSQQLKERYNVTTPEQAQAIYDRIHDNKIAMYKEIASRSSFAPTAKPWEVLGVPENASRLRVEYAAQDLLELFNPKVYGLHSRLLKEMYNVTTPEQAQKIYAKINDNRIAMYKAIASRSSLDPKAEWWQVLGVPKNASSLEVKNAINDMLAFFDPEIYEQVSEQLKNMYNVKTPEQAQAIYERIQKIKKEKGSVKGI